MTRSIRLVTSNNGLFNNSVSIFDWPSGNPDFNPIQSFWQVVKISNFDDLFAESKKVWKAILTSVCKNPVTSMPRRCQVVIDN